MDVRASDGNERHLLYLELDDEASYLDGVTSLRWSGDPPQPSELLGRQQCLAPRDEPARSADGDLESVSLLLPHRLRRDLVPQAVEVGV